MNAEILVELIEEMMDLKVQQHAETHMKSNPEVARILAEKRETDRRRLEQLRAEMARLLSPRFLSVP
jgi:ubiquinone biosynthesis protein Coq4